MRLIWVLIMMTAVGAAVAGLRSRALATQAELYRLEAQRLRVRRRIWEQQHRLGRLKAPREVELRRLDWALDLRGPDERPEAGALVRRDR